MLDRHAAHNGEVFDTRDSRCQSKKVPRPVLASRFHMGNLAKTLREEIRRLARREIRAELAVVKRATVQHRHEIARLKRELAETRRALGAVRVERERLKAAASPAEAAETKRWNPRGMAAHRRRLGLSAKDYGALVGVTGKTIYEWESGKRRPRLKQFAAVVALRGLGKRQALARLAGPSGRTGAGNGQSVHPASLSSAPPKSELEQVLRRHGGNMSAVARKYDKAAAQIYRWCKYHGITPAAYR